MKCQTRWPSTVSLPGLSDHQQQIAADALRRRVGVLAGTPGTGKTYTAAGLIRAVISAHGAETVAVAAPTGKAAVRCQETLQQQYHLDVEARTIHRLLEIGRNGHDGKGWGFQRNADRPLSESFLFVDESSMLDTSLAASLFDAVPQNGHVLLIGDPYQLPPVGHGAPLRDLIDSGSVGYGELSEIRRNSGLIVDCCRKIKSGQRFAPNMQLDLSSGMNWKHFQANTPAAQLGLLKSLLAAPPGNTDPVWDIQVLVAVNEKSPVCRVEVNRLMQGWLNPGNPPATNQRFGLHDKIICLSNSFLPLIDSDWRPGEPADDYKADANEFVANGELGRVRQIDRKSMVVELQSPKRLVNVALVGGSTRSKFDLGYAITCHKAQGSQAKIVITLIDDSTGAGWVTSREWYYTAFSRAEIINLTIGRWETFQRQCQRVSLRDRKTFLKEQLLAGGLAG